MVQRLQPDILLLDIQMPTLDGLSAIPLIRDGSPRTKVLILSGFLEEELIVQAIEAGARGYLLKTLTHKELAKAIRSTHEGELWADRRVLSLVVEGLRRRLRERAASHSEDGSEPLTDREQEIVKLVMQGKRNKEIAAALHISEKTVKSHMSNIFTKLHINRRLELLMSRITANNEVASQT
jgi:DNA-binding NarL/FixJ family response regulator